MSVFTLYLLTLLPKLSGIFKGMAVICFVIIISTMFFKAVTLEYKEKWVMPKVVKPFSYLFVFLIFIGAVMPDKEDLYFIAGGYYVTNNEEISKLPDNIVGAITSFLEEMKPEPKQEKIINKNTL